MKNFLGRMGVMVGLGLALGMTKQVLAQDITPLLVEEYAASEPSYTPNKIVPLNAISPETVSTFVEVIDLVRRQYIHTSNDEQLFFGAMRGVLGELDGYGEFLDEEALKNLQAFTEGSMANVGLRADFDAQLGQWVVKAVAPDSSASLAGIEVGDYLHQINDKPLSATIQQEDIVQLLSGIAGTQVVVVTSHAGRGKHSHRLQRTTPNTDGSDGLVVSVKDDIVIVRLPIFTEKTRSELIEALAVINTPIKGMIIDVRNNPGGVLLSAIHTASLFTQNAAVLTIVERNKPPRVLGTQGAAALDKMPIMLVQNRYSASAAEILAQALKADSESIIVGETSYGKGSIQSVIPIGHGQAVKLTTGYYLGVNDTPIDGIGVIPDVVLNFNDETWMQQAVDIMQSRQLPTGVMISLPSDY